MDEPLRRYAKVKEARHKEPHIAPHFYETPRTGKTVAQRADLGWEAGVGQRERLLVSTGSLSLK